jgi:hypothetical protein
VGGLLNSRAHCRRALDEGEGVFARSSSLHARHVRSARLCRNAPPWCAHFSRASISVRHRAASAIHAGPPDSRGASPTLPSAARQPPDASAHTPRPDPIKRGFHKSDVASGPTVAPGLRGTSATRGPVVFLLGAQASMAYEMHASAGLTTVRLTMRLCSAALNRPRDKCCHRGSAVERPCSATAELIRSATRGYGSRPIQTRSRSRPGVSHQISQHWRVFHGRCLEDDQRARGQVR